jgi:hypothetical protein
MEVKGIDEKLQRHQAFWTMGDVDQPLIGVHHCPAPFESFEWADLEDGELAPHDLEVPFFLSQYEQNFAQYGLWDGDLFWFAYPLGTVPWMEAIMGARPIISRSGHSMWSEPTLDDWNKLDEVANYRRSPWLAKLLEFVQGLVDLSAGRFPVAMCLQRGPLDVAAALRGQDQICLDLYDHPEQMRDLLDICTEANLHVAKLLADLIPDFYGGHVNYFGLWAPRWPYLHQQDAMASFSPNAYRDLIRPLDVTIMSEFDYSIRKFHSASLHILDEGLNMDAAVGIQVTVDPNGPGTGELVDIFATIQQHKPLLVNCVSEETMEVLAEALSPKGLCLCYWPL